MSHSIQKSRANENIQHYRMVAALAAKERDQDNALSDATKISAPYVHQDLSQIAQEMGVPVAVATYRSVHGVKMFATFGLDMTVNWALFADICEILCAGGATVIPNIAKHEAFQWLPEDQSTGDIRFLVGVPLRNELGEVVGSLAVLDTQCAVARKGLAISKMADLGKSLIGR
jgi:hypothetical protein